MSKKAILVHYDYCTGCKSCEISCKNEKGYEKAPYGVTVMEHGPHQLADGTWEWDYLPVFSGNCDLCEERIDGGDVSPCVLHCLAQCLEIGPEEDMVASWLEKPHKAVLIRR